MKKIILIFCTFWVGSSFLLNSARADCREIYRDAIRQLDKGTIAMIGTALIFPFTAPFTVVGGALYYGKGKDYQGVLDAIRESEDMVLKGKSKQTRALDRLWKQVTTVKKKQKDFLQVPGVEDVRDMANMIQRSNRNQIFCTDGLMKMKTLVDRLRNGNLEVAGLSLEEEGENSAQDGKAE